MAHPLEVDGDEGDKEEAVGDLAAHTLADVGAADGLVLQAEGLEGLGDAPADDQSKEAIDEHDVGHVDQPRVQVTFLHGAGGVDRVHVGVGSGVNEDGGIEGPGRPDGQGYGIDVDLESQSHPTTK